MPLIGTRGAASAQGFGEFAQQTAANYIEDVFSTYLYTGNASTQNIVNGIDLAGKGGLVWGKTRNSITRHVLFDTARGVLNEISSNLTAAQTNHAASLTAFNSNGYTLGNDDWTNYSTTFNSVSWTFRKQPKFFDVVTYTGDGVTGRTINHNLQSIPGCVIIKRTDTTSQWLVWHQTDYFGAWYLNQTYAKGNWLASSAGITSTTMRVDGGVGPMPGGVTFDTNAVGGQYVAYLFAHNAGGFGTAGTDNVISCGSYTTDGSGNATISLGYEPQWVMIKNSGATSNWVITDNMRGMPVISTDATLRPNTDDDEVLVNTLNPTATGFQVVGQATSNSFIYIAIRRGPMKTPTSGTSVYFGSANSASTGVKITTGFPVDLQIGAFRSIATNRFAIDRLRGTSSNTTQAGELLRPNTTDVEFSSSYARYWDNTGYQVSNVYADNSMIEWNFGRAPSFMDMVCYTGTGSATTQSHNLGVAPEFMLVKSRSNATDWMVYAAPLGNTQTMYFQRDNPAQVYPAWNNTTPTSTVFSLNGSGYAVNNSGNTYVAYLFASCPGVSKVGSYSGTGATQTISCGFAARFVLIKRTDDYADWLVWDTARGMVAGTDPRIVMNLTSTETNANWVYTNASGFQIVTTDASVNANGGSYIYLAIA